MKYLLFQNEFLPRVKIDVCVIQLIRTFNVYLVGRFVLGHTVKWSHRVTFGVGRGMTLLDICLNYKLIYIIIVALDCVDFFSSNEFSLRQFN